MTHFFSISHDQQPVVVPLLTASPAISRRVGAMVCPSSPFRHEPIALLIKLAVADSSQQITTSFSSPFTYKNCQCLKASGFKLLVSDSIFFHCSHTLWQDMKALGWESRDIGTEGRGEAVLFGSWRTLANMRA